MNGPASLAGHEDVEVLALSSGTMKVSPRRANGRGRARILVGGPEMAKRTCSIELCENPAISRGWCSKHYSRWLRLGDPRARIQGKFSGRAGVEIPVAERAWRYIQRDRATGCWNWTGAKANGYGRISTSGRRDENAHRALYEVLVEKIAPGLVLDHLCRNTACVNPAHMEPVTVAENTRRGMAGDRARNKTHCKNGHEFTPENTRLARRPSGSLQRVCRACRRKR